MNASESFALLAQYEAAFRTDLGDGTKTIWRDLLMTLPFAEAQVALGELIATHVGPFAPPIGRLVRLIEDVLRRLPEERPALPDGIDPSSAEEVRSALDHYWRDTNQEDKRLLVAAGRSKDPAARVDAARARTLAKIISEIGKPDESADRPPKPRLAPGKTACGAAWGTAAIKDKKGRWICPSCRSPIEDGCLRSSA